MKTKTYTMQLCKKHLNPMYSHSIAVDLARKEDFKVLCSVSNKDGDFFQGYCDFKNCDCSGMKTIGYYVQGEFFTQQYLPFVRRVIVTAEF